MRWLAFLLLLGTPAFAQVTIAERIVDCQTVRKPAKAYEAWLGGSCHTHELCEPFEQSVISTMAKDSCFEEAYTICEFRARESQAARDVCVEEVNGIVSAQIAGFDEERLRARIESLLHASVDLSNSLLERTKAEMDNQFSHDCSDSLKLNIHAIAEDEFCDRIAALWKVERLRLIDWYVSKLEAEQ